MNDQADLQKKNDVCTGVCVCTSVEAEKTVDELNRVSKHYTQVMRKLVNCKIKPEIMQNITQIQVVGEYKDGIKRCKQ